MKHFENKVAVITGGASGIGLSSALALARNGAHIVLADVEESALKEAVDRIHALGARAIGVCTDVGDRAAMFALADEAFAKFGGVHILFNNAGVGVSGRTQDATHADWEWSMRVNLWGPIHGVEAFVPRMVEQKQGGHVLFTSSFAGLVSNRNLGPYCVTKFGIVALAECLRKDLREDGIGVSVLAPMRVATRIDFSKRNRPEEFGGPSDEGVFSAEELAALSGQDLSADTVAEMVLAGIRDNELYIHTHREARQFVKRRWERMDEAFDRLGP